MKLHFLGANRQVTGSRYCLETHDARIMVDCGMFQEREFLGRNWEPCPLRADQFHALLLTHAHLDHCGLIPKLVAEGFLSPIYCTPPTVDLTEIILRDSAGIQEEDAAYKRKRHAREGRRGKYEEQPLYMLPHVVQMLPMLQGVEYGQAQRISPAVSVTFHDAGHILGSAMLDVRVTENGRETKLLFSGDIGQAHRPLIREPSLFESADYVIMESTYGDRDHVAGGDIPTQLRDIINHTVGRGGNVVIPTFAVERAQELMYFISQLVHAHQIPDVPVYLDSPMSVDVTEIFRKYLHYLDEETGKLIQSHQPPLHFPGLHLARSTEDSKAINQSRAPSIIMASSGMCNAGRIKHHLRYNIERPESTILFVGYQSHGTLGRQILDGNREVRIHGRQYRVRAKVDRLYGFSGHADRAGLLRWIGNLKHSPRRVFLTHGEEQVALSLAAHLRQSLRCEVTVPEYREVVELN